jgi:hypothetical protein
VVVADHQDVPSRAVSVRTAGQSGGNGGDRVGRDVPICVSPDVKSWQETQT